MVLYFFQCYNLTQKTRVPNPYDFLESIEDVYAFATRESLAAPNDVFRLVIKYEIHECNELCDDMYDDIKHHEIETHIIRGDEWISGMEALAAFP